MAPKPDPLHPPTGPRAGTGQEPTVIEAGGRCGDTSDGHEPTCVISHDPEIVWRPVLGYESLYEVSSNGDVRRATGGKGTRGAGHVLSPCVSRSGYRQIVLRKDGKSASRLICQLVCESFHGPRPVGQEVRHLDGNSLNDTSANLRWGTHYENVQDMRRHGTHRNSRKAECKNGHPFTAENTITRSEGGRRCRTCRTISSRKAKAARRAALKAGHA